MCRNTTTPWGLEPGATDDKIEDVVCEVALPLGPIDNGVCALDETRPGLSVAGYRGNR